MKKLFIFIIIALAVTAAKAQSSMESSKYPTQYQQNFRLKELSWIC